MNMLSVEQQNKVALSFIKLVVKAANLEDTIDEEFTVSFIFSMIIFFSL